MTVLRTLPCFDRTIIDAGGRLAAGKQGVAFSRRFARRHPADAPRALRSFNQEELVSGAEASLRSHSANTAAKRSAASWTDGLIGIAGANGQGVQLCCFLQANKEVTTHPQSREPRLEFA